MRIVALLILFLLVCIKPSLSQPITIQGNLLLNNTETNDIASFDNDTIIAISHNYSMIKRSTDGGKNWTTRLRQKINTPVYRFLVFDNTTAVALGDNAFFMRTTDAGLTWTEMTGPGNLGAIYSVYKKDSTTGYIGGNLGRFWKTQDKGQTWSQHALGIPLVNINAMQWINQDTCYFGTGNGLYRSVNNASTFTLVNQPIGIYTFCMHWKDYLNGMIGNPAGYFLSTDGGLNWIPGTDTTEMERMITVNDSTLYCHDANKMYRSFDAGLTWEEIMTAPDHITTVHFSDFSHGFFSMDTYIGYTTDTAATWTRSVTSHPYDVTGILCDYEKLFQKDSLFYFYGTSGWNVARIHNNGESSDLMPHFHSHLALDFIDATSGFFVDSLWNLYYFTDTGSVKVFRKTIIYANDLIAFDSLHLLVSTSTGIIYSIDGGTNFTTLLPSTSAQQIQKVDSLVGFVTNGYSLCRTIDGGVTWTQTINSMRSINFCDSLHGVTYDSNSQYISITNDGGQTYIPVNNPTNAMSHAFRINDNELFVLKDNDSLYLSQDQGQHFIPVLPGWTGAVNSLCRSSSGTVMMIGDCFLLSDVQFNGTITVGTNEQVIENYIYTFPNPSNDYINVKFENAGGKNAIYNIMDLTGRLVQRGFLIISPNADSKINIASLISGSYILSVGDGDSYYRTKFMKVE